LPADELSVASSAPQTRSAPRPVAPTWHTVVFLLVVAAFAAVSALTQEKAIAHQGRIPTYILTLAWEWLLVGFIVWGTRRRGVRLRDLTGGRWQTPEDALLDFGIAFGFWLVALTVLFLMSVLLGLAHPAQIAEAKKQIEPLMPRTSAELALWIALSATAGFCEEIMFRGYLQTQFAAFTRSSAAAVLLQAVVFGAGHAYQGARRIPLIAVYGLLFGLLALWRRSLRPGMIGHTLQDAFSGIVFRLLK
jgi:membrane protease YdiL (CAAX protease family)